MAVSAYTEPEYQTKMAERLAELHEKYGDFDEINLLLVHIRKFGERPEAI